jgi:hypothetical protein
VPTVSPRQGIGNPLGMGHKVAQILPDKGSALIGRAVASLTTLGVLRINGLHRTPTHVVTVPVGGGAGNTGRLAHPTTDQGPQQIRMGLVVARSPLFVSCQFGLNMVKVFLRD